MSGRQVKIIDEMIMDDIRRYSQPDLIRKLFPGHPVKNRGAMPSPLRDDRNASYSCFCSRDGIWKGKDFSTGEVYDNIRLYREVFPNMDFIEAVDSLSWLVLGKSALVEYGGGVDRSGHRIPKRREVRKPQAEKPSALKVIKTLPLFHHAVPQELVSYWRSRGISDNNISHYCDYARFESSGLKGKKMIDGVSGLPIIDKNGEEMVDDGIRDSIGMRNDVGGMVFRVPKSAARPGFKGATTSYITTFLSDGSRPIYGVDLFGKGDGMVHFIRYDESTYSFLINPTQRFFGVTPQAAHFAAPFMDEWKGKVMDERDVKRICAVLTSLNSPICGKAAVVEGMFDGLSFVELQEMSGRGFVPGVDLVILNSITNLKWAVPFLSMRDEVMIIFDNDLQSGAGKKAFNELSDRIHEYSSLCGKKTLIRTGDYLLQGSKDLNDALIIMKDEIKKKSL